MSEIPPASSPARQSSPVVDEPSPWTNYMEHLSVGGFSWEQIETVQLLSTKATKSGHEDIQAFVLDFDDKSPKMHVIHSNQSAQVQPTSVFEDFAAEDAWSRHFWMCFQDLPELRTGVTRLVFVNFSNPAVECLKMSCPRGLISALRMKFNLEYLFIHSLFADPTQYRRTCDRGFIELAFRAGIIPPLPNRPHDGKHNGNFWDGPRSAIKVVEENSANIVTVFFQPPLAQNQDFAALAESKSWNKPYPSLGMKPQILATSSQGYLTSDELEAINHFENHPTTKAYLIGLYRLNADEISKIHSNPTALMIPLWRVYQSYFLEGIDRLRRSCYAWMSYRDWSAKFPTEVRKYLGGLHDEELSSLWARTRHIIEDFDILSQNVADHLRCSHYSRQMLGRIPVDDPVPNIDVPMLSSIEMLKEARNLETYMRETIQMNVGNLSLRESRRSLAQADSIGRVTFLAFVFIPLSLVTSFFGMNIQELTGSGASWRIFFMSSGLFLVFVILACLFLGRKGATLYILMYYLVMMKKLLYAFASEQYEYPVREGANPRERLRVSYSEYWRKRISMWLGCRNADDKDMLRAFMDKARRINSLLYFEDGSQLGSDVE